MIFFRYCLFIISALSLRAAFSAELPIGSTIPSVFWEGQVRYSGAVMAAPCAVSLRSKNQQVDMGTIRSNQFHDIGSWASPRSFSIELEGCDTNLVNSVGIFFKGITDGKDPLVFKTGIDDPTAHGIGLGIFDKKGVLLVPNSLPQNFEPLQQGNNTLVFTAKYRATDRNISPGSANAWINFFLVYP